MTVDLPALPPIPQIYAAAYTFAYVFLLIGVVEQFRIRRRLSPVLSRKIVGLGASLWTLAAPWLFIDWYWAISVPGLFLVINAISMKFGVLPSIDAEKGRFGAVAFSIILCASIFIGWFFTDLTRGVELRPLAAFCILPSSFADSFSALIGTRYGKGELIYNRSKIGTAAGIAGGMAGFVLVGLVFGLTGWSALLLGAGFGVLTGFTELVSPVQLDNLTTGVVAGIGGYLILLLEGAA